MTAVFLSHGRPSSSLPRHCAPHFFSRSSSAAVQRQRQLRLAQIRTGPALESALVPIAIPASLMAIRSGSKAARFALQTSILQKFPIPVAHMRSNSVNRPKCAYKTCSIKDASLSSGSTATTTNMGETCASSPAMDKALAKHWSKKDWPSAGKDIAAIGANPPPPPCAAETMPARTTASTNRRPSPRKMSGLVPSGLGDRGS